MAKSGNLSDIKRAGKDAVVEYWENRVLGISKGIDDVGSIQWELAGTLLIAWILCYICIFKGIKTSGKVVYFTATFPYLMMTILLIRGLTLEGAWDGIKFYLSPDFSMIWNGQVWIDAGTQIFFSYAIALGTMTALGSYNEFNHNFVKDCTIIACFNSGTSFYAGFVIFSVLGFMANDQGIPISAVAEKGPGLAFIAYPKAISQMGGPWAQCSFSICFFLMIIMLGIGSQFVGVEGFVTAVVDVIPQYLRVGYRRQIFVAIASLISYLIGLSMVTNGGMYMFQLFDYYSASGMCLLWVCFFQCIAIAWVEPGIGKWMVNIRIMLGHELPVFFRYWLPICWSYITPLLTMTILLSYFVNYEPLTYNKWYVYPFEAQVFGWCLALCSMLAIPVYFIYFQTTRAIWNAEEEYGFPNNRKKNENVQKSHVNANAQNQNHDVQVTVQNSVYGQQA
jgi:solute carrier family 6 GABA transporter-like protein 6/8/11/12/13